MINYKKQTKSGSCGIFNLANIIRNKSIIEKYGENHDYIPCGNYELNKILAVEFPEIRVEPLINSVTWKQKIPVQFFKSIVNSFINDLAVKKEHICSFILQVQTGNNEFGLHAISLLYSNGKFIISDPIKSVFESIDGIDCIFEKYKYVNSINSFLNNEGNFTAFTKELYKTGLFD